MANSRHGDFEGGEVQQDTIFITGLEEDVTEQDLADHFGAIGIIKMDKKTRKPKIWIYKDKGTGRGKGEATITYDDPPTASSAINWFNGREMNGKVIKVVLAQRKNTFNSGAFGGPGGGGGFGGGGRGFRGGRGGGGGGFDRGGGGGGRGRGRGGGGRDGDWTCSCGNTNFAWRNSCNRCNSAREGGDDRGSDSNGRGGRGLDSYGGGRGSNSYGGGRGSDSYGGGRGSDSYGGGRGSDSYGGGRGSDSYGGGRGSDSYGGGRNSGGRDDWGGGGPMRGGDRRERDRPY